jgi:hypothetical protein
MQARAGGVVTGRSSSRGMARAMRSSQHPCDLPDEIDGTLHVVAMRRDATPERTAPQ